VPPTQLASGDGCQLSGSLAAPPQLGDADHRASARGPIGFKGNTERLGIQLDEA
jgi:hypothetical protein